MMHTFKHRAAVFVGLILLVLAFGAMGASGDLDIVVVDGAEGVDEQGCGADGRPCASIQYAIDQYGQFGITILVTPGDYVENLVLINKDVTIQGGYGGPVMTGLKGLGPTTIDGHAMGSAVSIDGGTVTLKSLTIANGRADNGGGVAINAGTVVITDCVITENYATDGGGGVDTNSEAGLLTIRDTQLISNTAANSGGALSAGSSEVEIYDSSIIINSATNSQSGAFDVQDDSNVSVHRSLIASNTTQDHGGMATIGPRANLTMVNCEIIGNSANSGNANVLANGGGTAEFVNCTVNGNNPAGAQAVILWAGSVKVTNSIWTNNALNFQGDPPCDQCWDISYSLVQGAMDMGITMGPGVFDGDAMFVGNGDYALQPDSPCVDAGTNVGAPLCDFDGNTRPFDGDGDGTATVDIGAHELTWIKLFIPSVSRP